MAEAATGRPILELAGVSKEFAIAGRTATALAAADLRVAKGEFVCLIGPSGCGKSTLLRLVAGFEAPSAGAVRMWGSPVAGPGPERGMVFQDYALFPWLTVTENIGFGPAARGLPRAEVGSLAARFATLVGLERFADAFPHQLSGGMKQRVAIARVLANDAELVLMDEPFGALDAMTRENLQGEMLDLWARNHLTVLFVTHAVEEAILLADRVVVMSPGPGRIVVDEPVPLPRPRDPTSPEFNALRRRLSALLGSRH